MFISFECISIITYGTYCLFSSHLTSSPLISHLRELIVGHHLVSKNVNSPQRKWEIDSCSYACRRIFFPLSASEPARQQQQFVLLGPQVCLFACTWVWLPELGQGQKAAAFIETVRHQNKETNKADIMITCKGACVFEQYAKTAFSSCSVHTHTRTHTEAHSNLTSFLLWHLHSASKKNKLRGKWINYKRGCRVLRRNQNSFRLNLGFPINAASDFEAEWKDKIGWSKASEIEGKRLELVSFLWIWREWELG